MSALILVVLIKYDNHNARTNGQKEADTSRTLPTKGMGAMLGSMSASLKIHQYASSSILILSPNPSATLHITMSSQKAKVIGRRAFFVYGYWLYLKA